MKLISKDGAIAAIRVVTDEVRPLDGTKVGPLVTAIAKRYSFITLPNPHRIDADGAKFLNGVFAPRDVPIKELQIFNDLVGATTTDTRHAEAVVDDIYEWLIKEHGFREPTTKPIRVLQSDLVVEFDNDPTPAFKSFAPLLKAVAGGSGRQLQDVGFARLDFGAPPDQHGISTQFIVERRTGAPWSSNRFFSKANMHTDEHIKALEILDGILGKLR